MKKTPPIRFSERSDISGLKDPFVFYNSFKGFKDFITRIFVRDSEIRKGTRVVVPFKLLLTQQSPTKG